MKLRSKHRQAIELLASGKRIVETASAVGVTERTVSLWLVDPEFSRAYQKRQSEYIRRLNTRLISLNDKAMDVLEAGMESRDESIKVRCASIVASKYHVTVELEDILQRLERLERKT